MPQQPLQLRQRIIGVRANRLPPLAEHEKFMPCAAVRAGEAQRAKAAHKLTPFQRMPAGRDGVCSGRCPRASAADDQAAEAHEHPILDSGTQLALAFAQRAAKRGDPRQLRNLTGISAVFELVVARQFHRGFKQAVRGNIESGRWFARWLWQIRAGPRRIPTRSMHSVRGSSSTANSAMKPGAGMQDAARDFAASLLGREVRVRPPQAGIYQLARLPLHRDREFPAPRRRHFTSVSTALSR